MEAPYEQSTDGVSSGCLYMLQAYCALCNQQYQHPLGLGLVPHLTGGKNLPREGMCSTQDCLKLKSTGRTANLS